MRLRVDSTDRYTLKILELKISITHYLCHMIQIKMSNAFTLFWSIHVYPCKQNVELTLYKLSPSFLLYAVTPCKVCLACMGLSLLQQ
jgi:hypothetical protein